jgi:hypothetical protein
MRQEDIDILVKLDDQRLLEVQHILNTWHWPSELPNEEDESSYRADSRRSLICRWIRRRLGPFLIYRHHHVATLGRSREEFEDWWAENQGFCEQLCYGRAANIA